MNIQTKLLHAILSGVIIAIVLGLVLIPSSWQAISQGASGYGPPRELDTSTTIIGIIASIAAIAVTLLSFKLIRRVEE
ncbi:MAG: hypothetical protein NWE84_09430 [Candidatus Bathyarchaeota archaeon]|nr:hypothetical protein [Candidatus Bathyarchaeota archaeon]